VVEFVTVTTDPSRDTFDAMRRYGPAHGLDPANWTFLTSGPDRPEDSTRKLAEAFGHKFTKTDDGYQIHGVVTHVIDKNGRWRANFHGLEFNPINMLVFINGLANDSPHAHGESPAGLWQRSK
jgi:protein SCO1/2